MKFRILTLFVLPLYVLASCGRTTYSDPPAKEVTFRAEAAPEWTALFKRSEGWFGGDGIFAIPFSGRDGDASGTADSVLFVFSDTMVGEIRDGVLSPGYKMINNSAMILKGKDPQETNAAFLVNRDAQGTPRTLFVPASASGKKGDYFWLGDGFVNNRNHSLYLFAYRIRNTGTNDDFPFREVGNSLLVIPHGSGYPFEDHRELELPFSKTEDPAHTSFGAGVLDNTEEAGVFAPDGFLYVYGVRGKKKELVAARVKPDAIEDFSQWNFWDGDGWSANLKAGARLADSVSNELSVSPIGHGQYALIYQYAGIFPTICMQIGSSPVGPFGPRRKVWDTSSDLTGKNLFSYNAKGHPAISKPGELIVSYNVNSFKFSDDIRRMPNLYRPRFIRIIFAF